MTDIRWRKEIHKISLQYLRVTGRKKVLKKKKNHEDGDMSKDHKFPKAKSGTI